MSSLVLTLYHGDVLTKEESEILRKSADRDPTFELLGSTYAFEKVEILDFSECSIDLLTPHMLMNRTTIYANKLRVK